MLSPPCYYSILTVHAATKYIDTAFISEVEVKDIDQYLKELGDAIKKNNPPKHG